MKKVLTIIFLLIIPFAYSISFDEFAKTYDFDFSTGDFNVTSIKMKPCTLPCANLSFELSVESEPGMYELFATFGKKTDSKSKYFFGRQDTAGFEFIPPFNGSEFWLKAVKDNIIIYFQKLGSFDISNITFDYEEKNKTIVNVSRVIFLNDSIKDGDLIVEYGANSTIDFYLFDLFSNFITNTTSDTGIALFNGDDINASELNGPYKVVGVLNGANYEYITNYYSFGDFNKSQEPVDDYTLCKGKNNRRLKFCFVYKFFKKNRGKKLGWFKKDKKEKNLYKKDKKKYREEDDDDHEDKDNEGKDGEDEEDN
ncbi:hypothetical protein GOV08_05350 [Candidatus Woesearchaeota archaeon]|nr:hypothetical protein [Candidatus Woesearchaeota archaeon]